MYVTIIEETGPIVKEIFERYAAGERGTDIATSLAERGILHKGQPFTAKAVYYILRCERYTGNYSINGEVYTNIYPKIIEPELYQRVRQKIEANRFGNHISTKRGSSVFAFQIIKTPSSRTAFLRGGKWLDWENMQIFLRESVIERMQKRLAFIHYLIDLKKSKKVILGLKIARQS